MFVRFGHSVPKMIFIMPPQAQKCPTFPFSCLNQTLNMPYLRQLNTSWTIIGGEYAQMSLDKTTGVFTYNLSLIVWNSYVHPGGCVKLPKTCPGRKHKSAQKLPQPRPYCCPTIIRTGHPATLQPTKTIKKTHFITRKTVINWYLLTKED